MLYIYKLRYTDAISGCLFTIRNRQRERLCGVIQNTSINSGLGSWPKQSGRSTRRNTQISRLWWNILTSLANDVFMDPGNWKVHRALKEIRAIVDSHGCHCFLNSILIVRSTYVFEYCLGATLGNLPPKWLPFYRRCLLNPLPPRNHHGHLMNLPGCGKHPMVLEIPGMMLGFERWPDTFLEQRGWRFHFSGSGSFLLTFNLIYVRLRANGKKRTCMHVYEICQLSWYACVVSSWNIYFDNIYEIAFASASRTSWPSSNSLLEAIGGDMFARTRFRTLFIYFHTASEGFELLYAIS